jgi:hypothetical protein
LVPTTTLCAFWTLFRPLVLSCHGQYLTRLHPSHLLVLFLPKLIPPFPFPSPRCGASLVSLSLSTHDQTDSLPPSSIRRIAKELSQLRNTPPEGIRVVVDEEDITSFGAWVEGPGQSLLLLLSVLLLGAPVLEWKGTFETRIPKI